jgi:hypothetical protein
MSINDVLGHQIVRANTSEFMPEGMQSHIDILSNSSSNEVIEMHLNLLTERHKVFSGATSTFVSDRALTDTLVYFILHHSPFCSKSTLDWALNITEDSLKFCDIIVVLTNKSRGVEENGVRVSNSHYASLVSACISTLTYGFCPDGWVGNLSGDEWSATILKSVDGTVIIDLVEYEDMSSDKRIQTIEYIYGQVNTREVGVVCH